MQFSTDAVLFSVFAVTCVICQLWLSRLAMRWDRLARRRYRDVARGEFPFRYAGLLYPNIVLSPQFKNRQLRSAHQQIMGHWQSVSVFLLSFVGVLFVARWFFL